MKKQELKELVKECVQEILVENKDVPAIIARVERNFKSLKKEATIEKLKTLPKSYFKKLIQDLHEMKTKMYKHSMILKVHNPDAKKTKLPNTFKK